LTKIKQHYTVGFNLSRWVEMQNWAFILGTFKTWTSLIQSSDTGRSPTLLMFIYKLYFHN